MGERAFWLAWSRIEGVGPTLLMRLHHHFDSLAEAWEASPKQLEQVEGFGPHTATVVASRRSRFHPDEILQEHEKVNPYFWTPADADYPRLLLEIPDPPPVLYYRGNVVPEENQGKVPAIAIVGTRDPSDYGRRWTRKLSDSLAQAGFIVVSGLADGVDTEAHQSCLNAGGRTIAVLGTGVDVVYPWSNRNLAKRIPEQGLLVSEYPAGTQPDRANFPRRNRIIAGLSRAILVLEAPHRSGALITARLATDYNRDVYALPGSLDNPRSKGCLELLNTGAHVILGESHLLEMLGAMPRLQVMPSPPSQLSLLDEQLTDLEPEIKQVLEAVPSEPTSFDVIAQESGLPTGSVLSALVQLELMGFVSQLPGMRYQRG
ncbi:DNA-processing protein DprA [Leptolyngbya sp. FACHB-671]|uniref:DNA-processing protein DprA n=1 Tax=Leptolyngbya sp. FACHB-671 TaxID=2692812 RepID=UPI001F54E81C|nr:DNA-processing protein DprA [Leptolyngbya sp. FACHB-671]